MRGATWLVLPILVLFALNDCAAQQSAPSAQSAIRLFAISGGVRYGDTGQTVEMIKVDLRRFTGETISSAFTRSNGEFEFGGLSRGNYYLVVEEQGYEPVRELVEIANSDRRGVIVYLSKGIQFITKEDANPVSARELGLPPKARDAYHKGAERLYQKKDPKGSMAHFRRAVEVLPSYYEAYFQIGIGHMHMGENLEAEKAFRKSIELSNDTYSEPYVGLALLLCNANKFAECVAAARRSIELDANTSQGHFQLARGQVGLDDLDAAEGSLKTVIKLKADYADAYLLYSNILIRRKDYPELLKMLDEYLKLQPTGPTSEGVRQTRDTVAKHLGEQAKKNP
jgi:tetratricopeptide (TPR) repeat protein